MMSSLERFLNERDGVVPDDLVLNTLQSYGHNVEVVADMQHEYKYQRDGIAYIAPTQKYHTALCDSMAGAWFDVVALVGNIGNANSQLIMTAPKIKYDPEHGFVAEFLIAILRPDFSEEARIKAKRLS